MTRTGTLHLLLSSACAFLSLACSSEQPAADSRGSGGDDGSTGGTAGQESSDSGADSTGAVAGAAGSGGSAGLDGQSGDGDAGTCDESNDQCPEGSYCSQGDCVPGCKNATACASGVCSESHDCQHCISDQECADGRVCGTGVCGQPCDVNAADAGCSENFTCCSSRCVDIERDIAHCGGCDIACASDEFCGTSGCEKAVLANVCDIALVTGVKNGLSGDDPAVENLVAALASGCSPPPTTRIIAESQADVFNVVTGRPVASGGELLAFAGGNFGNQTVAYLEAERIAPVYTELSAAYVYEFRRSSDGSLIASIPDSELNSGHDLIVIEVVREPVTGTLSLAAFGFTASGTQAAVWFFEHEILPALPSYVGSWYMYEWIDADGGQTPDAADTFTLLASG